MWFKLAGATFSINLGPMSKLSSSISIKYNANGFNYITGSVSKDDTSASLVLTLNSNYTYEHSDSNVTVTGATKGSISYSSGTLTIPITPSSGSTFGASGVSSINVTVTGAVSSGGSEGDEPEDPVNYTFTINPDPTSATVTLSATGYSTVSGTGSKSITVANGTTVSWSVSADGYTTQEGTWTANGSNESKSVKLVESGGDQVITFALGSALSYDASTKILSSTSSSNILAKNDTQKWIMQQPLAAGNEIEFDIIGTSTEGAGMYTVGLATTNNLETAMTTDTISTGNYNILSGIVGVYKDNKSASVTKLQCFATVPSTTLPKKPYTQEIPTTATVNYKIKRAADGTISIFVNDTQLTTSDTGIQGAFTAAKETAILYLCGHCTAAKESKDQRTVVFKYFGELR